MPFGPYADFTECVLKNSDKSSPEGFCAWLHKKILGSWPSGMAADKYPEPWLNAYDAALVAEKPEKEAFRLAEEAAQEAGFEKASFGWVKQYQAPNMKDVKGIYIFAAGTWVDSAGNERTWTEDELDRMKTAFEAGVPVMVPLKCGHTSDDFNKKIAEALGVPVEVVTGDDGQGQIKIGNMTSLERKNEWLVSAFSNIPEPIANLIEGGQYSNVSVEIEDEVGDYGPVITGVALLGAEEPAVEGATTEKALVFGGTRKGARVWSFKIGDELPDPATLRSEFDDIRSKVADIIKGKKGAPLFRALFGNITELFERMVGKSEQSKGGKGKMDFHTLEERLRGLKWAAQELGLSETATIEEVISALEKLKAGQANDEFRAKNKSKKGENQMKLPKVLEGKKPDEIRAMTIPALAKLFAEGDTAKVEELTAAFQEGDLVAIAAALGLGEEATAEDIMAAIKALMDKAAAVGEGEPEGGEMGKLLKAATDRIGVLEGKLDGQTSLSKWKEKTATFTSIPGTPAEHAVTLADIEGKAGTVAADTAFAALDSANKLAAKAGEIVGTSRTKEATDLDTEVATYMKENPTASKRDAISFARRKIGKTQ